MGKGRNEGQRVLMYHALESEMYPTECVDAGDVLYVLKAETFQRHLELLTTKYSQQLSSDSSDDSVIDSYRDTLITFDDGHRTNHTLAYPLLMKFNLRAHFFITTGWINNEYFMTDSMIKELSSSGMTIGSHGVSHSYFTEMDRKTVLRELRDSKKCLEDLIGNPVDSFAAPGGWIDSNVLNMALDAGYTNVFVSDSLPTIQCKGVNVRGRLALKRTYDINRFEKMLLDGRQPESLLFSKGVKIAKSIMGGNNYNTFRKAALGLLRSR